MGPNSREAELQKAQYGNNISGRHLLASTKPKIRESRKSLLKTFSSLTRRQTGVNAHALSRQSHPSAACPFPALCPPSSHMLCHLCHFQALSLASYSLQILFKLPSSPFILIFHAYPLLFSLNLFLVFHLTFTAQDTVKLVVFRGASWCLVDFSPLQPALPFAISVLPFLFAFLPSSLIILWAWLSSNTS